VYLDPNASFGVGDWELFLVFGIQFLVFGFGSSSFKYLGFQVYLDSNASFGVWDWGLLIPANSRGCFFPRVPEFRV